MVESGGIEPLTLRSPRFSKPIREPTQAPSIKKNLAVGRGIEPLEPFGSTRFQRAALPACPPTKMAECDSIELLTLRLPWFSRPVREPTPAHSIALNLWWKVIASNDWPFGHHCVANRLGSQPRHPPSQIQHRSPQIRKPPAGFLRRGVSHLLSESYLYAQTIRRVPSRKRPPMRTMNYWTNWRRS